MGKQLLEAAQFRIELEEGLHIDGDVRTFRDGIAKPALIIGHGFRGHKDWGFWPDIAGRFAERGFYAVSFNFSRIAAAAADPHGSRAAEASTVSREIADWEAVADVLLHKDLPLAASEADTSRLSLLGHSRAGTTGILFAAGQPAVQALIVWNGGGSPNRPVAEDGRALSLREQAIIGDLDRNADRFDVKRAFAGLSIPALVLQGEQDNARLLEHNRELRKTASWQNFGYIPGADHAFGASEPYEGATAELEQAFEASASFLRFALPKA